MYTAHRVALFTSATHLLGDEWLLASDNKKIECFLFRSPDLHFQSNVCLFEQVQSFISHSIHLVFLRKIMTYRISLQLFKTFNAYRCANAPIFPGNHRVK